MARGSVSVWLDRLGAGTNVSFFNIDPEVAAVWIQTRPIDIKDPSHNKHFKRFVHDIFGSESALTLTVEIYGLNRIDDQSPTLLWSKKVSTSNPLPMRIPGYKYIIVKFSDSNVDFNWAIFGFELWGHKTSRRF